MRSILNCLKLLFLCLSVSVKATKFQDESSSRLFLRGNTNNNHRKLNPIRCGCPGCTSTALDVFAGEFKCGDRINYLQNSDGFSERDACVQVAGVEFPDECKICDPNTCLVVEDEEEDDEQELLSSPPSSSGKCGCPECDDIWDDPAGEYSCGLRIEWLQSPMSTIVAGPYEETVACFKIASEEFPDECGKCDPSKCSVENPSPTPPTNRPTIRPTNAPTDAPSQKPSRRPSKSPTLPPTIPETLPPITPPTDETDYVCGCQTCDDSVWNTFAGDFTCGDRINYLKSSEGGLDFREACSIVAAIEFPIECAGCDPARCIESTPSFNNNSNDNNNDTGPVASPGERQKCGGAVNSSSDSNQVCQNDLWDATGDSTMPCFAYGGSGDPCHLSNNNDPFDGQFKDPSRCKSSDTFYLWDEPDTQGRSYDWAGRTWLEYSKRFANELREMRNRGVKVTGPLLKAGSSGVLLGNMRSFYDSCGPACFDESDPAYIDVLAINGFCGPFNGPAGCRGGASFIYDEAVKMYDSFGNIPVYITNWSKLQTSNPLDQVDAIDAIEAFFPSSSSSSSSSVVERVYWFGATDFGGGSSNNFLTNVLPDGSTLGELWRNKCDSI